MLFFMSDTNRLDSQTKEPSKPVENTVPSVNPWVYKFVISVMNLPVLLSGMRLEVQGLEHVPAAGTPLVIAANHQTGLDPFIIARVLPKGRHIQFMAKKELFLPILGNIIKSGGSFPVDRSSNDIGAIRTAMRILGNNGTVGIFPEGTRSSNVSELQGGVALIAAKGRAPILPVGLRRQGKRWIIRFGAPISPRGGIKAMTAELASSLETLSKPTA